jgi:hypothetical protein
MSSQAVPAFGTFLQREDPANPGSYATIAEVGDMDLGLTTEMEDVTSHSTGIPWREKIPTLLTGDKITTPINFGPQIASHSYTSGFLQAMFNRQVGNYKFIFVDAGTTTWALRMFVTSFKLKSPVNGVYKATVEWQITGQPTFA